MNVAFRLARAQDCAALTELSMRAKQSNGYGEEFMAACRAELTVTAAQRGCGEHWVIWPDDAGTAASGTPKARAPLAYGWLNWRAGQADGEIESFFVEPSGQRSGLGRRLWRHLACGWQARRHQLRLPVDACHECTNDSAIRRPEKAEFCAGRCGAAWCGGKLTGTNASHEVRHQTG